MNNSINREIAIKAIEEDKINLTNPTIKAIAILAGNFEKAKVQVMTCDRHIKILKDLPSTQPKPQWIPVTERLPENNPDYDILVTYAEIDEKRIIPVTYGHGRWFDCIYNRALNPTKVLAWMPLPKPYEACKKENTDE